MTKKNVGIVLEYRRAGGKYKIAKIIGAAIVKFPHSIRRVGDYISEESATALAVTHDVTTVLGK
tara:strand:- start:171 stop:362 length:192 start_codon:yes stop_codon:yes gene_type:complete